MLSQSHDVCMSRITATHHSTFNIQHSTVLTQFSLHLTLSLTHSLTAQFTSSPAQAVQAMLGAKRIGGRLAPKEGRHHPHCGLGGARLEDREAQPLAHVAVEPAARALLKLGADLVGKDLGPEVAVETRIVADALVGPDHRRGKWEGAVGSSVGVSTRVVGGGAKREGTGAAGKQRQGSARARARPPQIDDAR
jgi:hypothetical protein